MTSHKADGATAFLKWIVIPTFIVGIIIVGSGVVLVVLGVSGSTELTFFGQTFNSTNIGIVAIFLGATVTILLIRRVLDSWDRARQLEAILKKLSITQSVKQLVTLGKKRPRR
jgi:hypothetical protein